MKVAWQDRSHDMPISVYRRENAKAKPAEGDTRHDRATYNRVIGMAECAWLEHAVGVLVVGRNKAFVAIDGHRPVSMHENDHASSALSQVNMEPALGAVPDHAEPSACTYTCCPCDVDKALCNAKYSEPATVVFAFPCSLDKTGYTAETAGSKRVEYTWLRGGRGHLKIETRLRGERFESVRGECAI